MKKFSQKVNANSEEALMPVQQYMYDNMRSLGYAPVAGSETYSGTAPNYYVSVLGKKHNDAASVRYVVLGGKTEWLPVNQ
jgi:hypothetical protein